VFKGVKAGETLWESRHRLGILKFYCEN